MKHSDLIAKQKKRLLGYWRSDARKTLKEFAERKSISPKQLRFFRKLFGRLELNYRPGTFVIGFAGERKKTYPYKVLGADADSIVITWNRKTPAVISSPQIRQIHFEDDFYWVTLGNGSREIFKRIDPNASPLKGTDLATSLKRLRTNESKVNKTKSPQPSTKVGSEKLTLKNVKKPLNLRKWIGKRKGSLQEMGYKKVDDYIRDIRGR